MANKTTIKIKRVAFWYAKGLTVQQVADKLGASYMGVRLSLIRHGLLKKPLPPSLR